MNDKLVSYLFLTMLSRIKAEIALKPALRPQVHQESSR